MQPPGLHLRPLSFLENDSSSQLCQKILLNTKKTLKPFYGQAGPQ